MSLEGIRVAYVGHDGFRISVTRHFHDFGEIRATLGGGGDEASPQRVSPERRGVETGGRAVALQNVRDGLGGEAGCRSILVYSRRPHPSRP